MPTDRSMPTFRKAEPALVERFTTFMAAYPEARVRNTFGSPCAYVNGNMAVGLHASGWFVRLDPAVTAELVAAGGEAFSPMAGRPMTGYTLLPARILDDQDRLAAWVERSLRFASTLPPKESVSRKR
jgi:TfoX/Sxy family transcriptional regulator of competence genes